MQRAIELARLGAGSVAPNPMVGAVIVHNDLIIGEGYHHKFGEPHAEVNAINSVKEISEGLVGLALRFQDLIGDFSVLNS